ncbi:MAG TPA: hypothetical protein VGN72_14755 [Tepidisphaeraceae bacterium]|jgi:hypothetical protein|nr:hypothetical protein [Tepidisphaeraceae bacterium]
MQRINFGRIDGLLIRSGEPVLEGAERPDVVLEVKLGTDAEQGSRPESSAGGDFALKRPVVDLMAQLDRHPNARIASQAVKHGLPFCAHVEAWPTPWPTFASD